MTNVVPFDRPRRAKAADEEDGDGIIYCECGDAWWILITGAVCFRPDQTVSGWAGIPVCKSCQKPMPGYRMPTI